MSLQQRTKWKKDYRSMSLRFHPDKNIHEDASKMMGMINEAKEGLKNMK